MQLKTIINRVTNYKSFVVEKVNFTENSEHRDLENVRAIGVDEVQWHKGHKYQTVVYQLDPGQKRLLWIGPDRKAKTLLRFFRFLGKVRTSRLQFICSDMWKAYLKVIAKKAPQAIHVLDRFHIMQRMKKAIDQVRAAELKQLVKNGYEPILKGTRWLLLKRPANQTKKQTAKLKEILQYNLKSVRSHLLKEDFNPFWKYSSATWAGKFLDQWCTRTMRSKIEPMKKVARMLRDKRTLILNRFIAEGKLSSGIVEGFNTKLKLITRKSYRFPNPKSLRNRPLSQLRKPLQTKIHPRILLRRQKYFCSAISAPSAVKIFVLCFRDCFVLFFVTFVYFVVSFPFSLW